MEFETQAVAVESGFHPLDERGVGVEPRHLVLILVGHQLEQITRHGFRQRALTRRLVGFGGFHLLDPIEIAARVARALIGGEERDAPVHRLGERLRQLKRIVFGVGFRLQQGLDRCRICGGAAAPTESGDILGYGFAVELDCLLDGFSRERQCAGLICIANHD